MIRVRQGDEAALGLLLDRYRAPLHGFLWRRTDGPSVEDLFQETWLRVVRARDRFDPRRRFSTWLYQIANNLCRDRYRRRAVEERALAVERARLEAAKPTGDGAAPAGMALDMERRLRSLPERLREVLILRYYQDLGEAEIAQALRIPRGTVKSRLHAALRALRAEEEEPDRGA
jgi:RNA polymerase sigma-70 factor (ECF subfamily)